MSQSQEMNQGRGGRNRQYQGGRRGGRQQGHGHEGAGGRGERTERESGRGGGRQHNVNGWGRGGRQNNGNGYQGNRPQQGNEGYNHRQSYEGERFDVPQRQTEGVRVSHYLENYLEGTDFTPSSSQRFLSALLDERYEASFQLLRVTQDDKSLKRFRQSFMSLESSDHFFRVLKLLCDPKLSYGSVKICVTQCCEEIYRSRYLHQLAQTTREYTQENHLILLAWLLVKVMSTVATARADEPILDLARSLEVIQPGLKTFLSSSVADFSVQNLPIFQKQHDNDFPFDFRQVEILPSADEIRANCDMISLIAERLQILHPSKSVSHTVEFQYRLLRENWVQSMKEEYFSEKEKTDFFISRRTYQNPFLVGFSASKYSDKLFADVLLTPNPTILHHLKQNQANLKDYLLSKSGSRILSMNSSVLLLDSNGDVMALGTIASRDVDESFIENFKENNTLKVGLQFPAKILAQLLNFSKSHSPTKPNPNGMLISCYLYSSSVVSFVSPILAHLKSMATIPFQEEIIENQPSLPLDKPLDISRLMEQINGNSDQSQIRALEHTSSNRFSLIQGPPGTGKTYIGVQIAHYLLKSSTSNRILTLSYTNHALDSFMEGILDSDITFENHVKRLGRSHKTSSRMKQHSIGSLSKFNYSQLMCSKEWKAQLAEQVTELNKLMSDFQNSIGHWDSKSWYFVRLYLSNHGDLDILQQFRIPNGEFIAGRNGKAMKDQDVFRSWWFGDNPPFYLNSQSEINIWELQKLERHKLLQEWNQDYFQTLLFDFIRLYNTAERTADLILKLNVEPKIQEVLGARLLGSTTSSACMSSDMINQYQPTVLIIEEAAEILEAHILVNIAPSVKHVILIGDHKQLRPKVDLYCLQKVSNRGINLDVSLFERLATNPDFKLATLGVQHRMRPEISEIIRRSTYPDLRDHSSTLERPSISGLQSNLIFLDHNQPESSGNDVLEKVAKVNEYEVKMVVEIVHYLLLQGYRSDDIVILTPYLGQLFRILKMLSEYHMKAQISRMDADELNTHGFENDESESEAPLQVRVSTVDNFQGEEAKIIVCSLVRCNPEGSIGFLYEPERLNVMCSRARDGFILIGSISTILKSSRGSETWRGLINYYRERNYIFPGLPTICQRHHTPNFISSPEEFHEKSPDGGCLEPCQEIMQTCQSPVKHPCWRKCHPTSDFHKIAPCRFSIQVLCENGHPLSRECYSGALPKCLQMIDVPCLRGIHTVRKQCGASKLPKCSKMFNTQCQNSHDVSMRCSSEDLQCQTCQESQKISQNPRFEEELTLKKQELEAVQLQAEVSKAEFEHHQKMKKLEERIEEGKKQVSMFSELQTDSRLPKASKASRQDVDTKPIISNPATSGNQDPVNPTLVKTKKSKKIQKDSRDDLSLPIQTPSQHTTPSSAPPIQPIHSPSPSVSRLRTSPSPPFQEPKSIPFPSLSHDQEDSHANISRLLNLVSLATVKDKWMDLYLDCERFQPLSEVERVAIEGLKLLAEWKLDDGDAPHTQYEELVSPVSVNSALFNGNPESELLSICKAITLYLRFCFNKNRANPKVESFLLSAWDCREALISMSHQVFTSWQSEIALFLESVKKDGLDIPTRKKANVKVSLSGSNKAIDKWNLCVENFLKSKPQDDDRESPSAAVDVLMKMIGLESVKAEFVTLYNHILLSNERGSGFSTSYNIRFEGNPGTGKTTVARHYAEFLKEVEILPPECEIFETSGSKLMIDGPGGLKKELDKLKECGGGVVFVDEAYQLEPATNQQGAQILNFIIPLAERLEGEFGKIVWIFAGYIDDMEKLFNYNIGLKSRFPTRFVFEDYSNQELEEIFRQYLTNEPPVLKEKKKTKEKEKKSSSSNNFNNRNQYGNIFGFTQGQTQTDEWGNVWTIDLSNNRWTDEYGNCNAFGPTGYNRGGYNRGGYKLGSPQSPIVNDKSGISWAYDQNKKQWYDLDDPSKVSRYYPGKPPPARKMKKSVAFHVEDEKWIRIAIRRLATRRKVKGFGNARDVRLLFDKCVQRQSDRVSRYRSSHPQQSIDLHLLSRDDILGPKASLDILETCSEYQKLLKMEGLHQMKKVIQEILHLVIENSGREEREEPLFEISLNRVFFGNPGTGKTTVAQLYGRILCSLGMLSKGDTILKNPSDFIGNVIGSSEKSTRDILAAAEGCVLVIDEAYMLNPSRSMGLSSNGGDPYKAAVLDTLVEQVQGVPGDDRVVILLGYKKEMEDMFRNCNPGLKRRFQFDNPVVFEDYDDTALLKILRSKVKECGLSIDLKTSIFAIEQITKKRSLANFGNAGEVNNILNDAKRYAARRGTAALRKEDFLKGGVFPTTGLVDTVMSDLIGNDDIDRLVEEYKQIVEFAEVHRRNPKEMIDYNFLFVGSPGTGKTTVARKMGKVFFHLGLLPSDEVIDISAQDLVTGYLGQAGKKTAETLQRARGKVLFIDEAYQLNPRKGGQYMQEVVDEIVRGLTSEEIRGNMVLILAGYERDIDEMLTVNQGLRSRITKKVHFPDFEADKICDLLQLALQKLEFRLGPDALDILPQLAENLRLQPGFSNGRDVETLSRRIMSNALSQRNNPLQISADVLLASFNQLLKEMKGPSQAIPMSMSTFQQPAPPMMMTANAFLSPPPPPITAQRTVTAPKRVIEETKQEAETAENIDQAFLQSLQNILDERGLNSKEGIQELLDLSEDDFEDLAADLAQRLRVDVETVKAMLREWQQSQRKMLTTLEELENELAIMKKTKKKGRVPIWRCAVCGRADKPYIACYVAPYVVRYEERELNE